MRKYVFHCVIALVAGLILVSCSVNTTADLDKTSSGLSWEQAWDNNCGAWSFSSSAGATLQTTLGSMYSGSNFSSDIELLNIEMSSDLGADAGLGGAAPPEMFYFYIPGGEIEPE